MSNILNWPDYKVLQVSELEHDYQVHAEVSEPPTQCPHCNHPEIVGFGRRDEVIMDTPVHGRRTGIMLNRRRYRCQSCRKTFLEPVPHKDEKRQMTNRLIQYIERESLRRTFSSVAEDVGVDEKTVRNIFNDYCERLEKTLNFEMPQWLGIDEIHIIKPRCVITNIQQQTIVDMLDNRNKTTVTRYLSKRTDRDLVRYVAMDMWRPYRQAVETMIPDATVIIDKFHVVRMANESLERARKAIRSALTPQQRRGLMRDRFVLLKRRHELTDAEYMRFSGWTLNYPEIGQAVLAVATALKRCEPRSCLLRASRRSRSHAISVNGYPRALWAGCRSMALPKRGHPLTTALTYQHWCGRLRRGVYSPVSTL
ncbi:ISL3 family transposase [Mannheimia haemolytica]|nr:ISL3 family transposase [Mannheimia haemolytica]